MPSRRRGGRRIQRGRIARSRASSPHTHEVVLALTPGAREQFEALWLPRVLDEHYAPDDLDRAPRGAVELLDWLDADGEWSAQVDPVAERFAGGLRTPTEKAVDIVEKWLWTLFGDDASTDGASAEDVERFRLALTLSAALVSLPDDLRPGEAPPAWRALAGTLLGAARRGEVGTVDPDAIILRELREYGPEKVVPAYLVRALVRDPVY